jgi:AcrR family transcriptional regulator
MRTRLDPAARRRQIVDAAMPLFARKGFSRTTTKEVAEAAGVSEGLLFKYFASKTALYGAIIEHCRAEDPGRFQELAHLPPSTLTLARMVDHLVRYFTGLNRRTAAEQNRQRLFVQSLLDDGEFARLGLEVFAAAMQPLLHQSLTAARSAGELATTMPAERGFRLMALLQIMLGALALHDGLRDAAADEDGIEDIIGFILRGLGVKPAAADAAIAALRTGSDTKNHAGRTSSAPIARVA